MKNNIQSISISKHTLAIVIIFILGVILRFYNLNWDWGQYLHPDERLYINAANLSLPHSFNELLSPSSPLNPHMFYYGSFPLYLYKFVAAVFIKSLDLLIVSRMISAFFSSLTIIIVFLAAKQFLSEKIAIISALVFSVSPGSIQYAHFNTTESLLIFLMMMLFYLSRRLYNEKKYYYCIYLGIFLGLAYATKIVGLTFVIFPLYTYILLFFEQKQERTRIIISSLFLVLLAILVGTIMAPYQLIDWTNFSKEQSYMQAVTYGKFKPPFVIIYEGTFPYLFPLLRVLPFTFGIVALCCSLIGILLQIISRNKKSTLIYLAIFPLFYFLWAGAWYAKFSRYYLLLVPFLSLYAGIFLSRLRPFIRSAFLFLIIVQGLLFFRVYLEPNTRITASIWTNQYIPNNATIATEHWDDALPLQLGFPNNKSFINQSLTVYDEDNSAKISILSQSVAKSDYIILSSRRVYVSILNNPKLYPYTTKFYHMLFSHQLGYSTLKTFTNYPYGFSDDMADESFQSYDHPPVIILKNSHTMTAEQIEHLLLQ